MRSILSTSPNQSRPPYASLHAGHTDAERPSVPPGSAPAKLAQRPATEEAGRLAELRSALWAAFEAGSVPAGLIDLTMAYTAALRLEMSLTTGTRNAIIRSSATGPPLRGRG